MNAILKENKFMHWSTDALLVSQPYCEWSTYLCHSCFNRLYCVLRNKCGEKIYRNAMCPCVSMGTFSRSLNVWQYFIMACMEKLTVHLKWWVGLQQLLPEQQMKNAGRHFKKYKQVQEQLKKARLRGGQHVGVAWQVKDVHHALTRRDHALTHTHTHTRARARVRCLQITESFYRMLELLSCSVRTNYKNRGW